MALARALVSDPELVLLDEPFAALDAITRLRMHNLVRALRRQHHAAMLLVTHDVDEAIALADRIVVMSHGRIATLHPVTLRPPSARRAPRGRTSAPPCWPISGSPTSTDHAYPSD